MPLEHEELTGRIIGGAIAVHEALGPGFLEAIYEEALAVEFRLRGTAKASHHRVKSWQLLSCFPAFLSGPLALPL